ncbi:MAG: galactokinase [Sphingorhabdus sp.]
MKDALSQFFNVHFGSSPTLVARAPGRVNLIGEHTDYNDGFVLPCAISKQTMAAVRARDDGLFRLISADLDGATAEFTRAQASTPGNELWANYARGMVDGLLGEGIGLAGADIAIMGDMPQGTGLSSSAALENAIGLALASLGGRPDIDRTLLARLGQRTEHDFAGCKCGIMDQLVSASALRDTALLIDCRSLKTKPVSIPDDLAILIVQSGIERGLVDGEYNSRRAQCEAAAAHYGVPALRDLVEVPPQGKLDVITYMRARHVITENARTLAAADALEAGDLIRLGELMRESHRSMRDDFGISLPAIDRLQAILADSIGTEGGARLTGGGFGGAVVALSPQAKLDEVMTTVTTGYRTPAGHVPDILVERPASGAEIVN